MRPSQTLRFTVFGSHFGFPECCIKAFAADYCHATKALYPEGPWVGTGFIPCACCAEAALDFDKFVAERITPNRTCATPFPWVHPQDPCVNEMADFLDNLQANRATPTVQLLSTLSRWTQHCFPALAHQLSSEAVPA